MAVFCLVHGSAQGPAAWDRLRPELARRGHACVVVDLPVDEPDADADRYAREIARALDRADAPPQETVVVAHSASGLFLPLVPELRAVQRLVCLAALVPEPGKSPCSSSRRSRRC